MIFNYDMDTDTWNTEAEVIKFTDSKQFLKLIKEWTYEKGYDCTFISKLLGKHKGQVSRMFSGSVGLSLNELIVLLRFLGYRLAMEEIIEFDCENGFSPDEEDIKEAEYVSLIQDYAEAYKKNEFKGTYFEYCQLNK